MNGHSFEELKKDKVTFGKTTFLIEKMPAVNAFEVLEILRVAMGEQLDKTDSNTAFIKAIMKLPPHIIMDLQQKMFRFVCFTHETNNKTPLKLEPHMQESAFHEVDAYEIYELTVRCFVRNFFYTFQKLLQFMAQIGVRSDLINPE